MFFLDLKLWKFVLTTIIKEKIAHFLTTSTENVTPVYKDFKGWKADFNMTTYEELPIELKVYWIIEKVEVPIKIVSVDQTENKLS
jgi:adenylosuccinate synthase